MFGGLRQLPIALIRKRRVVVRVREVRLQLDGLRERRHGGAPVGSLAGRQPKLIVREWVAAVVGDREACQFDSAIGVVGDQRLAGFRNVAPSWS